MLYVMQEVCAAIWEAFVVNCMLVPAGRLLLDITTLPNCAGSVDLKLVRIERPMPSGSTFCNYGQCRNIVLQAVPDANYKVQKWSIW